MERTHRGFGGHRGVRAWTTNTTIAVVLLFASTFPATAAIYMEMPEIPGEVTTEGYEHWISLHDVGLTISVAAGGAVGGGGATSKVSLSDFSWNQALDSTWPNMLKAITSGKNLDRVKVHFTAPAPKGIFTYFELEFTDV